MISTGLISEYCCACKHTRWQIHIIVQWMKRQHCRFHKRMLGGSRICRVAGGGGKYECFTWHQFLFHCANNCGFSVTASQLIIKKQARSLKAWRSFYRNRRASQSCRCELQRRGSRNARENGACKLLPVRLLKQIKVISCTFAYQTQLFITRARWHGTTMRSKPVYTVFHSLLLFFKDFPFTVRKLLSSSNMRSKILCYLQCILKSIEDKYTKVLSTVLNAVLNATNLCIKCCHLKIWTSFYLKDASIWIFSNFAGNTEKQAFSFFFFLFFFPSPHLSWLENTLHPRTCTCNCYCCPGNNPFALFICQMPPRRKKKNTVK